MYVFSIIFYILTVLPIDLLKAHIRKARSSGVVTCAIFYGRADKGQWRGFTASVPPPFLYRRPLVRYTPEFGYLVMGTPAEAPFSSLLIHRTIAPKHGWFLRHGLFCIINIDRGMAQFVLQDKDIRALLHAMLFVELQVVEHFLHVKSNALIDPLIHALHKQLIHYGRPGRRERNCCAAISLRVFSGVKLDRSCLTN